MVASDQRTRERIGSLTIDYAPIGDESRGYGAPTPLGAHALLAVRAFGRAPRPACGSGRSLSQGSAPFVPAELRDTSRHGARHFQRQHSVGAQSGSSDKIDWRCRGALLHHQGSWEGRVERRPSCAPVSEYRRPRKRGGRRTRPIVAAASDNRRSRGYERVCRHGESKLTEALIARDNTRLLNNSGTPERN